MERPVMERRFKECGGYNYKEKLYIYIYIGINHLGVLA